MKDLILSIITGAIVSFGTMSIITCIVFTLDRLVLGTPITDQFKEIVENKIAVFTLSAILLITWIHITILVIDLK